MNDPHGFTKENLLSSLPIALAKDPKMVALAEAIAGLFVQQKEEIGRLSIYPQIGELDEALLDILAHDFKVDWWDNDYALEEKRRTLQSSWQVHKLLGTKAAVEQAISAIYPHTTVKEWFEYGGQPYHFKLDINITNDDVDTGKQRRVMQRLNYYKNLRSHLDSVGYFMISAPAVTQAGAVLLSHSEQVSVGLKPDAHWPRSDVGAASGAVFLASSGICSVELPEIKPSWPRVRTDALAGAAHLGTFGVCSVELSPVRLQWPRVKSSTLLGGTLLGMSAVCSAGIPQVTLRWPRVGLSGTGGAVVLAQTMAHRVSVRPKKLAWPKSTATTKFGVAVLGIYQKITV